MSYNKRNVTIAANAQINSKQLALALDSAQPRQAPVLLVLIFCRLSLI